MKELVKKLVDEFNEYFDGESEYGIGYLDALCEVCQRAEIKHERKMDNLIILEDE
jgi:hypothetical protein